MLPMTNFVEDIQQTVNDLEQKGITFLLPPVSAPDAAGVVCAQDPDGILIEFGLVSLNLLMFIKA